MTISQQAKVIVRIEMAILVLLICGLISTILLMAYSFDTFSRIYHVDANLNPEYESEDDSLQTVLITYVWWGPMLFMHVITMILLKIGMSRNNFCLIMTWVVLQSIMTIAGVSFGIGIYGFLMTPSWWIITLFTLSYVYRTYSIHIIRLYSTKIRRLNNIKV